MLERLPDPYRPILLRSLTHACIGVRVLNPRFGQPGDTFKAEWLFDKPVDVVDWRDIPDLDDPRWLAGLPEDGARILTRYRTPSGVLRHVIEDAAAYRLQARWIGGAGWMPIDAAFAAPPTAPQH